MNLKSKPPSIKGRGCMMLSYLSYTDYRFYREMNPEVAVEDLAYIYGPVVWSYEERYRREVENES